MLLGRQPRPGSPEALTGGPVGGDYYGFAAGAGQLLGVNTAIRCWESLLLFATGRQWESSLLEPDHDHDECGSDGSRGRAAQTH